MIIKADNTRFIEQKPRDFVPNFHEKFYLDQWLHDHAMHTLFMMHFTQDCNGIGLNHSH